jgi:hypothetical protein
MTPEELIKEAYRRYPLGSVFKSIFSDHGKYRKVIPYNKDRPIKFVLQYNNTVIRPVPGMKAIDVDGKHVCSNPAVYENGKWCPSNEYDIVKEIMEKYNDN